MQRQHVAFESLAAQLNAKARGRDADPFTPQTPSKLETLQRLLLARRRISTGTT